VKAVLVSGVVDMERIAQMLSARRAVLAAESLRAIRAGIPAYGAIDDPSMLADVTEHVAETDDALRASLVHGRAASVTVACPVPVHPVTTQLGGCVRGRDGVVSARRRCLS
jgi:hypothetical protein